MIVTLTGENAFGLRAELDKRVAAFIAEHSDMALERLDGEEATFERMQEALQSLPFLASKRMVVLRDPSKNKQFAEAAAELLADVPETTDVIVVESKLDKRLGYYKFLKKSTEFHEFAPLDRTGLAKWLAQAAKEQGGKLSLADATYLVDRVGQNQQALGHELDKLLLYAPDITRKTIDLLTEAAPQSTIFELLEAAFAGNARRAMTLYDEQRALKVEPQQIIAMLAWQLHVLALVKTAGQYTPDQVARDAKLNPYVLKKSTAIARQLAAAQLKQLIADLLTLDVRLKREQLDAGTALRNYLLSMSI